jgi:hypothetical protein
MLSGIHQTEIQTKAGFFQENSEGSELIMKENSTQVSSLFCDI